VAAPQPPQIPLTAGMSQQPGTAADLAAERGREQPEAAFAVNPTP